MTQGDCFRLSMCTCYCFPARPRLRCLTDLMAERPSGGNSPLTVLDGWSAMRKLFRNGLLGDPPDPTVVSQNPFSPHPANADF